MILNKHNGLQFFTFSHLETFDHIRHGVFTRTGGFSALPQNSLNIGINVGDDPELVMQNRAAITESMGGPELVFLNQTHETGVIVFDQNSQEIPLSENQPPFAGDAMITNIPGKTLAIQVADCQAVMLYDPEQKVIANVHSGWRGSIWNITGKCVETMKAHFGCRPADIIAGVGPSLGPCCSEFVHYKQEIPKSFWRYKDQRDHFNFWAVTRDQLVGCGLAPENIELSYLCTKCNVHLFFSYRQANQTGRFVSVIGLK
jgi:YfiH family protein